MLMSNDVSQPKSPHPTRTGPDTRPFIYMEISPLSEINKSWLGNARGEKKKKNPPRSLARFKELALHQQPKLNGVNTLIILPFLFDADRISTCCQTSGSAS